jgi:hypothetical protein
MGQGPGVTVGGALPLLSAVVKARLRDAGRADLANQLDTLPIIGRCECGDDFCCTVYTGEPGEGVDGVDWDTEDGMVCVHTTADERVVEIEVLFADGLREELDAVLPIGKGVLGSD